MPQVHATPRQASRLEAFLTGIGLAHLQVALGFVAMRGIGASATAWFVILFCWLLGGLSGVLWMKSQRHSQATPSTAVHRRESALLASSLLLLLLAELSAQLTPFSLLPRFTVMLAATAAGAYGGAFLSVRGSQSRSVAVLFFHENNGFLTGFLVASGVLLLSASLLLPVTALSVLAARAARSPLSLRPPIVAVAVGIGAVAFQLLFRWGGDPHWDALMTASVLTHPESVSLREWLFFAHPLVIPLTAPFQLLVSDPLQAVSLRETVCHGALLSLLYLASRALCTDPSRSLMIAAFACLQVFLSAGRWQLVLAGEEKEVMLLFGSAFLIFYLDHRGLWHLGVSSFSTLAAPVRRLLLGILLALAVGIHLLNGLLIVWLLVDLALATKRRQVAYEIGSILLYSVLLAGPFFMWLAIGPGEARTPQEVLHFFLEYHVSGEFLSFPATWLERCVECYSGLRAWLFDEWPIHHPMLESATAFLVLGVLCWSALRQAPHLLSRLLAWVLLLLLHFFFFQPWNPEAWSPSVFCGSLIVALGLLGRGRWLLPRKLLAIVWIATLALVLGINQKAGLLTAERVREFISADHASATPLRDLVRWLDVNLERDAEILVKDRLLLSYFQLYTTRGPVIQEYLGLSKQELRTTHHLTTLSLRFYAPKRRPEEIDEAIRNHRPVYLISTEPSSAATLALPMGGLVLSRLTMPLVTPPAAPIVTPFTHAAQPTRPDGAMTEHVADDLLANDLTLTAVTTINPTVYKLSLRRNTREFAAKWKPLGSEGSEEQEGFDGNNAPRCELAARRIDRWLSGHDPRRQLVPEVVVRALHRNVPCDRPCQAVPKLIGAEFPPTFPMQNDHLVLGALSEWIEEADMPTRFQGGLWNPQRFAGDPEYRRSIADLVTFLFLIAHGDANYADNFLVSRHPPFRAYSIDNGRSLDGIPFYTEEGDPDWQPLAQLTPQSLLVPSLSRQTLSRIALLPQSSLPNELRLLSAIELRSGRVVSDPTTEPLLTAFVGRPLSEMAALRRVSRQSYLTTSSNSTGPWLLLGLSAKGIADLLQRAQALISHQRNTNIPLFD